MDEITFEKNTIKPPEDILRPGIPENRMRDRFWKAIDNPNGKQVSAGGVSGANAGTPTAADATSASAAPSPSVAAASGGAKLYSNEDAINQLYDAQRQARAAELGAAYEQSRSNYQAAADKLPGQYQANANDLAVQYERNKRNFNEQALSSGVNTGAGSQAELAQNAAWLRNYGNLRNEQTAAETEAQRQLNDLYNQYQANVNAANAQIDAQRGAALIDERNQQYNRDLAQAQALAQYGDFSGYRAVYGDEAAANMENIWAQQNPDIAYIVGKITKDQRDNIKRGRPINDGLDGNGVRIKGTGGGGGTGQTLADTMRIEAQQLLNRSNNGSDKVYVNGVDTGYTYGDVAAQIQNEARRL